MITKTHSDHKLILIALASAVMVHASLLLIKLEINNEAKLRPPNRLTIQLQKTIVQSADPYIEELEISQEKIEEPVNKQEPQKAVTRSTETNLEKEIAIDSKPVDQGPTTAIIINSVEYKQWIRSETKNHIENNPDSLADFADSFALPVVETAADIETQISPLGTGLSAVRNNGKVTCQLQTVLPFHNDFSKPFMTYKDCTPAKKFVLNTK